MTEERPKKLTYDPEVIGSSGLRQTGGYVYEEQLPELVGQKGAKYYREMADNDPVVGAMLFAIETLIRQCKWTVQAVNDSPEAEEAKVFLEQVIDDMSVAWSDVISEISSMFTYGYAPMEIIWKRRGGKTNDPTTRSKYDDGRIGVRNISLRAQTSVIKWEIDDADDSIDGMWQQPHNGAQVFIPVEKMLLFRTKSERNNPEGRSILRAAYEPWYYKRRIQKFEAMGIERDLVGLPVVKIPGRFMSSEAEAEEKRVFRNMQSLVTSMRRDGSEGIVMPSDRDTSGNLLFELTLLSTGGSRTFDTDKIKEGYKKDIATTVLADFIFLGQQAVGSFALSSDKTALFATAIGAFNTVIADTFNRHFVPRLWELNGFDDEVMPILKPSDLEQQNIGEIADFVSKLTSAGAPMFPDRELENTLREMAGLPPAPEEGLEGGEDMFGAGLPAAGLEEE